MILSGNFELFSQFVYLSVGILFFFASKLTETCDESSIRKAAAQIRSVLLLYRESNVLVSS